MLTFTDELLLLLSHFSHIRLCDPRDGSPPGSAVPWILQARTLEWVAISFSSAWKWKVKGNSLSRARLLATPWTAAYQTSPSLGFSRQEYWNGVPLPSPMWVKRQQLTRHETTDGFQIGKEVWEGCILSPCLFNLCNKYIIGKVGLDQHKPDSRLQGEISATSDMQMTPC